MWVIFCTNVLPPQRGGAVPSPLTRDGLKWRDNHPDGSGHLTTPNRLDISYFDFPGKSSNICLKWQCFNFD